MRRRVAQILAMEVIRIPGDKVVGGHTFPLTYKATEPGMDFVKNWVKTHKAQIFDQTMTHGAVLLREAGVSNPEEFADVVGSLELENMPYVGGAAVRRNVVGDRVFTSNESPPSEPIPFHHEMAQLARPPQYLFFYCDVEATEGGDTPIIISNEVYNYFSKIHPEFCKKVEELGIRYTRIMPSEDDAESAIGRSWRNTFLVETKEEAEEKMRSVGTTWEWRDNGDLYTQTAAIPSIRKDSRTGRKLFFNSMVAAFMGWQDGRNDRFNSVHLGDGSPVDRDALEDMARWMQQTCVSFTWKKGDVLIIDNRVALHSRKPFTPPRRILASIGLDPLGAWAPKKAAPAPTTPGALYHTLRTGDEMPVLGLGVWKISRDDTAASVLAALKMGYRHLDCACDYGNEKEVGEGIRTAFAEGICTREELWVTSKLWNTYHAREHVEPALQRTLSDLGLDYVDLYLVHFPIALQFVPFEVRYPPEWVHDPASPLPRMEFSNVPMAETWGAMEDMANKRLTRNIGVCNMTTSGLRDMMGYAKIRPAVLQVELHPYNTQTKLLKYCAMEGICVTGFSPLGAGSYTEIGLSEANESALLEPVVKAAAAAHSVCPAQVLLRWAVQRGTSAVAKSTKAERLAANIDLFSFSLTEEEMAAISALNKGRRFNDPGFFCEGGMNTYCPIYD